jgi:hypothetical protein
MTRFQNPMDLRIQQEMFNLDEIILNASSDENIKLMCNLMNSQISDLRQSEVAYGSEQIEYKDGNFTNLIETYEVEAFEADIEHFNSITEWSPTFDLDHVIAEIVVVNDKGAN